MAHGIRFFVCLLLSAGLIYGDLQTAWLDEARKTMSLLLSPFRAAVQLPANTYRAAGDYLSDRETLLSERDQLKSEILRNDARLKSLDFFARQNAELRGALRLRPRANERWVIADVDFNAAQPLVERIHLNKGFTDGIIPGLGVVDQNGVVGQIVRVGDFTSVANLLTDAKQYIAVYVRRNDLLLIARGSGVGNLIVEYASGTADLQVGDELLAAGGGVFPPGYPVAVVDEVQKGNVYLSATATPISRFWDHTTLLIYQQQIGSIDGG